MQWTDKEEKVLNCVLVGLILGVPFLIGVVVGYVIKYYVGC